MKYIYLILGEEIREVEFEVLSLLTTNALTTEEILADIKKFIVNWYYDALSPRNEASPIFC